MQNHIITLDLPKDLEEQIKEVYKEVFKKEIPIFRPHITLLAPFAIKDFSNLETLKERLKIFSFEKITTNLGEVNIFEKPNENILYIPVLPLKEIAEVHQRLTLLLGDIITFETSIYPDDQVPTFLAHISLDYDFSLNQEIINFLQKKLPKNSFSLEEIKLLTKKDDESWQEEKF